MFPTEAWDYAPTVGWQNPPLDPLGEFFWRFSGIGTLLDYPCSSARKQRNPGREKGD
jgi:hypothetical protein